MTMLSKQTIEAFQQQGAVLIRGMFTDWVESLRTGIDKNIAAPGPFVRDYQEEGGGRFYSDFCNWDRIPEYRSFLFESPAAEIAGQLMQSKHAQLFHEHVLVKEPGTALPTPWHHDQPYYCVNGDQNCSLWLALDHVPRDRCVEFIAGSHRWGKWFRPERFDRTALNDNESWEVLPDIEANREAYEILGWQTEPGDVVAFHFRTVHGAPANRSSSERRRAFSSRWVGDDATFADRHGNVSPPFPDCKLSHGERLSGPEFPIVRGG
jgi:ectoine hydroxylase-related dioxygenase (phytanoyl-CoA dioxygenase family)